ncbi:hypothetical protein LINPERPRIM_LOCUS9318 [Linum perenne]
MASWDRSRSTSRKQDCKARKHCSRMVATLETARIRLTS